MNITIEDGNITIVMDDRDEALGLADDLAFAAESGETIENNLVSEHGVTTLSVSVRPE